MNKLFVSSMLILLVGYLNSCAESTKKNEVNHPEEESRYAHLLSQFEPIQPKSLHIYSSPDYGRFKGKKLNSADCKLLPIDTRDMNYIMDYGVYACYKFRLDSNHVGLIIRTPSMYESSSIDMFVWDIGNDKISYAFQLAQSTGDAGVYSMKTALLEKLGEDYLTFIYDHESEADDEDTTGLSDLHWDFYYHLRWKNERFDTVSTDAKLLSFRYRKFLKKYKDTVNVSLR